MTVSKSYSVNPRGSHLAESVRLDPRFSRSLRIAVETNSAGTLRVEQFDDADLNGPAQPVSYKLFNSWKRQYEVPIIKRFARVILENPGDDCLHANMRITHEPI